MADKDREREAALEYRIVMTRDELTMLDRALLHFLESPAADSLTDDDSRLLYGVSHALEGICKAHREALHDL